MTQYELSVPDGDVASAVEACAARLDLDAATMALRKYPGATHWHFTKPGSKGTLECSWYPAGRRLWLSVHTNRQADWHREAIQAFAHVFITDWT